MANKLQEHFPASGLKLNLLREYVFINLDIYFKIHQNMHIDSETDAWLTFLGTDSPELILTLLEQYPWFEDLYRDLYTACLNTERVMYMFSEELKILDRNTVQYMIDEMADEIKTHKKQLEEKDILLSEKDALLSEKDAQLDKKDTLLENVCRSLVMECREKGQSPQQAEQVLCDRVGMDKAAAAEMVERFWSEQTKA